MKETIFISHANPEDNYYAAWLASKLRLFGYKVWVDVKDIKPGQYFNRDFEKIIREETIKFLSIVSKDYLSKSKQTDSGVMNEILCARTIKDIEEFIIPLRFDSSDYSDFTVGIRGRQAINFSSNWAEGINDLIVFFEELKLPKGKPKDNIIQLWFEAQKIKSDPIEKQEKYLTNWFPINLLENIYIHKPNDLNEKDFAPMPFSYIREGDRLISFINPGTIEEYTKLNSFEIFKTNDFIDSKKLILKDGFELIEPNKKLVKLLNKIFKKHLKSLNLQTYEQANKKEIYYFKYSDENRKMVSLRNIGKTRRSVIGTTSEFTWHFAISHNASLFPNPCFRVFYHLVFTDKKGKLLSSEDQHELRRSLPSDWYNRKWLDTLLAMMLKIAKFDPENIIKIEVDKGLFLSVNVLPISINSNIGYKEPSNELEA